jgi:hypothetical protein
MRLGDLGIARRADPAVGQALPMDLDAPPTFEHAPRFNHVAMSVPADLLAGEARDEVLRFYRQVFGWEELPTMTVDRKQLVLSAWRYDQFVFLIADDEPMRAPRLDHWGLSVSTLDELEDLLARVKAFAEDDERVDLIDHTFEDHEADGKVVLRLHSFYVGFLLPLMVEVQCWEWQ